MHRTHGCCASKRRVVKGLRWVPWHPLDAAAGTHVTQRPAGDGKTGGVVRFMSGCHVTRRLGAMGDGAPVLILFIELLKRRCHRDYGDSLFNP